MWSAALQCRYLLNPDSSGFLRYDGGLKSPGAKRRCPEKLGIPLTREIAALHIGRTNLSTAHSQEPENGPAMPLFRARREAGKCRVFGLPML